MIRTAEEETPDGPGGPGGPTSPLGPGGPAGPGSPFLASGSFPQATRMAVKATTIRARYNLKTFQMRPGRYGNGHLREMPSWSHFERRLRADVAARSKSTAAGSKSSATTSKNHLRAVSLWPPNNWAKISLRHRAVALDTLSTCNNASVLAAVCGYSTLTNVSMPTTSRPA
jgi:hypothetical protein